MSMNWLGLLAVTLPLAALVGWQAWIQHQTTVKWMRLFSAKLEIPPGIMDRVEQPKELVTAPKQDTRKRISIPLPGTSAFTRRINGKG